MKKCQKMFLKAIFRGVTSYLLQCNIYIRENFF